MKKGLCFECGEKGHCAYACPKKKVAQGAYFFISQIEVWHLAAAFDAGGLRFHPAFQCVKRVVWIVVDTPADHHVAHFGGKIGTLAEDETVTIGAGLFSGEWP